MKLDFCCQEIENHLSEKEVALEYCGVFGSYGIRIPDGGSLLQKIYFCPWCGTCFPKGEDDLSTRVCDSLILEGYNRIPLRPEFKSGEWWRKKRL